MQKMLKIPMFFIILALVVLLSREWLLQSPKNIIKALDKRNISEIRGLTYKLNFISIIPFGVATVENKGLLNFRGRNLRYFRGSAKALKFFSILGLNAECELESYVDPINFNAYFFQEKTKTFLKPPEHKKIIYNQEAHMMEGPEGTYPILPNTKDLLSICFYFKNQKFELGKEFEIYLNTNQKNYILNIKVSDKNNFNVDDKNFTVWVLESSFERYDKSASHSQHEAFLKIWILEDYENIPIRFEVETCYPLFVAYLIDVNCV